jgi:cell filamentation protein
MKQRILVMNGHRLVQSEYDNEWVTTKVGKAGQIPPGIYNISGAVAASKDKSYDGVVLHADQEHVYQQVGKTCVRHSSHDFPKSPSVGANVAIRYDADRALASEGAIKRGNGVKR